MNYKIMLANGLVIDTEMVDFNADDLGAKLNNDSMRALTVGDFSISKNAIMNFVPDNIEGNVEITTSDNQKFLIKDDAYDAAAYSDKINSGKRFCVFGNAVISSNNYFMARPVEKQTLPEHP